MDQTKILFYDQFEFINCTGILVLGFWAAGVTFLVVALQVTSEGIYRLNRH